MTRTRERCLPDQPYEEAGPGRGVRLRGRQVRSNRARRRRAADRCAAGSTGAGGWAWRDSRRGGGTRYAPASPRPSGAAGPWVLAALALAVPGGAPLGRPQAQLHGYAVSSGCRAFCCAGPRTSGSRTSGPRVSGPRVSGRGVGPPRRGVAHSMERGPGGERAHRGSGGRSARGSPAGEPGLFADAQDRSAPLVRHAPKGMSTPVTTRRDGPYGLLDGVTWRTETGMDGHDCQRPLCGIRPSYAVIGPGPLAGNPSTATGCPG